MTRMSPRASIDALLDKVTALAAENTRLRDENAVLRRRLASQRFLDATRGGAA